MTVLDVTFRWVAPRVVSAQLLSSSSGSSPLPGTRTRRALTSARGDRPSRTAPAVEPDDISHPAICADTPECSAAYRDPQDRPTQMAPWDGSVPASAPCRYLRPTLRPPAACETPRCRSWH